ncbi:hypothetical protein cyc_02247 [Cyclospora cayetanensis]|uniref:Cytochrome b5 heme-binding domain-containing protein n=1 Tax=Cyclospora cayetanensis TaxID=88456 RepID=A0A1D3D165_9EIME|nr:hypothetical protein cyc_02247 [Cyclospora cayetanensis]
MTAISKEKMSHWIGGDGTAGAADATREAAPPKEASATAAKAARPSNPAQPSAATLHPEESCILGTASTAAATAAAGVCGVEAQEAAAARATPDDSVPLDVIAVTDGQDITEAADISMAASSTAPIGSTLGAAKELFAHPAAREILQKGRCCLEDEVPSRMHRQLPEERLLPQEQHQQTLLSALADIFSLSPHEHLEEQRAQCLHRSVRGLEEDDQKRESDSRSSIRMAYDFVMRWLVGRGTLAGSGRAEFPLPHSSSSSGGRGDLPSFTPCQVYRHFLLGSLLLYANKKVYKINGLLGRHPGGDTCLLKHLAQDCTRDFLFHTRCGRCLWRGFLVGVSESCAGWTDSKQQRLAELKEQFLLQYMQKHQPDMQHEHSYQQSWLLLQQQQQAFKTLKDAGCNRCRPEKLGGLRAGEALAEDEDNRHMPEADA